MTDETIWGLFSIANNYDQPDYNLEVWWKEAPSLDILFKHFGADGTKLPPEDTILAVVQLWQTRGTDTHVRLYDTNYRMLEVREGIALENVNALVKVKLGKK